MHNECKEFLQNYLSHSSYNKNSSHEFYKLFKAYSAYEVRRPEDIKPAIDEFFAFLQTCPDIPLLKRDHLSPLKLAAVKTRNLHKYLESPITAAQKGYSQLVSKIAPKGKRTSILDVGAGLHPKSSIFLATTFDKVTAMDREFLLSVESLAGMNVRGIEKFFTEETDVSDYDLVVGRFPCSAIIDIVKTCSKHKKPYFIQLCDCKLPPNPDPNKYPVWTWEQILRTIDPKIRIYGSCAYHVNIPNRKMMRLINKFIPENEQVFSSVSKIEKSNQSTNISTPELSFEDQLEYARIKILSAKSDNLSDAAVEGVK